MEKYVRYKRFSETHTEITVQEFYNKLITEGWEIIYYNEIIHPVGALAGGPQNMTFYVVVVAGKRQEDTLSKPSVL
jgi:hypothetical protein